MVGRYVCLADDGREEKGRLYKPTSKLAEFATTVKESHESKESRNARKERERESRFEPQVVSGTEAMFDECLVRSDESGLRSACFAVVKFWRLD